MVDTRRTWALLAALLLLVVACGGGENSDSGSTTSVGNDGQDRTTTTEATSTTEATEPGGADEGPALICEDPEPVEVGLGEPIEGQATSGAGDLCFWVEVPAGLDAITIEVSGASGPVSAGFAHGYLYYIQFPGAGPYWRIQSDGEASAVVERPAPGPYFVTVGAAARDVDSPFTVTLTADPETTTSATGGSFGDQDSCGGVATQVDFNGSIDDAITEDDVEGRSYLARRYYCTEVPAGVSEVTIVLSGLDGFLEPFARTPRALLGADRSRSGDTRTIVLTDVEPGAIFIDVASALQGATSSFTLAVSGS